MHPVRCRYVAVDAARQTDNWELKTGNWDLVSGNWELRTGNSGAQEPLVKEQSRRHLKTQTPNPHTLNLHTHKFELSKILIQPTWKKSRKTAKEIPNRTILRDDTYA